MEPSSPTAIKGTLGEMDGAWLQLPQLRRGGRRSVVGCSLQRAVNGAGREAPQSVTVWSQQSLDVTANPREKILQEEGDWLLGEAGSHSWCGFCWFVPISTTLHRVSCQSRIITLQLQEGSRSSTYSPNASWQRSNQQCPPKHCQDTSFSSPTT